MSKVRVCRSTSVTEKGNKPGRVKPWGAQNQLVNPVYGIRPKRKTMVRFLNICFLYIFEKHYLMKSENKTKIVYFMFLP